MRGVYGYVQYRWPGGSASAPSSRSRYFDTDQEASAWVRTVTDETERGGAIVVASGVRSANPEPAAKRRAGAGRKRNPERLYHVVVRDDRTGVDSYMTVRPESHHHATVILSKQTPIARSRPHLRYLLVEASTKTNRYAKAGEGPSGAAKRSVRKPNPCYASDDAAIRAFLDKREATSKQLSSTGSKLSLHWPSATIAEWVGGQIRLGTAYGNVSQSYIKKVARLAPVYLLTRDSWWVLPAKTVKLLKSEGRG